jgi:hypothetical protein
LLRWSVSERNEDSLTKKERKEREAMNENESLAVAGLVELDDEAAARTNGGSLANWVLGGVGGTVFGPVGAVVGYLYGDRIVSGFMQGYTNQ